MLRSPADRDCQARGWLSSKHLLIHLGLSMPTALATQGLHSACLANWPSSHPCPMSHSLCQETSLSTLLLNAHLEESPLRHPLFFPHTNSSVCFQTLGNLPAS